MGVCPPSPNAVEQPIPPGLVQMDIATLDSDDNDSIVTFNEADGFCRLSVNAGQF